MIRVIAFCLGLGITPTLANMLLMQIDNGGGTGPTGDSLLLVNATDHVLLVNATDDLCLAATSSC
jgi:hypothetical protein